jgi:dihydrofolate reductase
MSDPGKVVYSMTSSLDGYIEGPDGNFDWSVPSEELHRFHNERVAKTGAHLLGRNLYETMVYWETPDPDWGEIEVEFAGIWQALPKIVFSSTLDAVEGKTRLATGSIEEELARVRSETEGDIGLGGATLAAAFARLDLIDEYDVFVAPVIVGGGKPFFPPLDDKQDLKLAETRTFGDKVVNLRYVRDR